MKIRHLLLCMLAVAATVACDPVAPEVTPSLDVDKTAVSVTAEAGQATFNVTTNQDWTASADADWVSVNPNNGKASDKAVAVTVTAEDNTTEASRTATVTVKAGTLSKTLKVTQAAKATTPEPPGPGDNPTPQPEYTLDGKQWMAEVDGMQVLFDFDLLEEGFLTVAMPSMNGTGFSLYMTGLYEIAPADATSGVITFTSYDWEFDEFSDPFDVAYSELSETYVKVTSEDVFGVSEPITFTVVDNPYEIELPDMGGDDPSGTIENGDYWIIETGAKVAMAPLSGDYGYPEAGYVLAVNGTYASTVENAYTFIYHPETSYYTIQDSNGKYLYMKTRDDGSWYTSFNVDAEYVNDDIYHWVVFDCGDGTYDIYNVQSAYQIAYSASYNSWGAYEWGSGNALPTLVKADYPVEEPEPGGSTLTHPLALLIQ